MQAINYLILKDYNKALEFFDKSDESLKFSSKENRVLLIENQIFKSSLYRQTGEIDKSKEHLNEITNPTGV